MIREDMAHFIRARDSLLGHRGIRAVGPDHRALLPASIFGGAILLLVCDTLARTVAAAQLPTGAMTALLGGPFFIAILVRQKQRASLWGRA